VDAKGGLREVTIEAKVIRANGDVEDRGIVSYWSKNPIKRLVWRLRHGK
jgi:hypothetical protein